MTNLKEKQLKKLGYNSETGFAKVGFVVSHSGAGQIPYLLTKSISAWYEKNISPNITVFAENVSPPSMVQDFALYPIRDIVGFDGVLIATSFQTAMGMVKATRAKRYWYVYDLEWKQPEWYWNLGLVKRLLESEDISKITRSKTYYDHLTKEMNGKNVNQIIIDDFNLEQILSLTGVIK
jgi:hypothetical protein